MRIPKIYYINDTNCRQIKLTPNAKSLPYMAMLSTTLFQQWHFQCRDTPQLIEKIAWEVARFNADVFALLPVNGIQLIFSGEVSSSQYGEIMYRVLEHVDKFIK